MPPLRFVTANELKVEQLPWGPHTTGSAGPTSSTRKKLLLVPCPHAARTSASVIHPAIRKWKRSSTVLEGKAEQWVDPREAPARPGRDGPYSGQPGTRHLQLPDPGTLRFLAILSPAKIAGPALVDVSEEDTLDEVYGD